MKFNVDIIYKLLHIFIDNDSWMVSILYHSKSCYVYYKKELIACVYYNEKRKIKKGHVERIINDVLNGLHIKGYLKLTCKLEKKLNRGK